MKVVVTGATGFIGRPLCAELVKLKYQVTALSRDVDRAREILGPNVTPLAWGEDHNPKAGWKQAVAEADAVIHLAGAPVAEKAWTPEVMEALRRSRVESTRALVDAMRAAERKPSAFLCASGVNYYGDAGEALLTEDSPPGNTFLAELAVAWEREASQAEPLGVRVVRHRIAMALERGGALEKILFPLPVPVSPWKLGLGGPIGRGSQWFPWIHLVDVVGMFLWSLSNPRVCGAVNTVAPQLVRNVDFSRALGRALHRPAVLPVPVFALKALVGDFAIELVTSQRAVPTVAQNLGYVFRYRELDTALRAIFGRQVPHEPPGETR